VLIDGSVDADRLLVAFHGYGESAEDILEEVRRIPGATEWRIVSIQALNRFYTRGDQKIVANWMTRQDREHAIADNVEYVNRALDAVTAVAPLAPSPEPQAVFVGFSQGVAMAYRAAILGRHRAAGVIALGGDIPPELKNQHERPWCPVLIGAGAADPWYTAAKVDADAAFLQSAGVAHEVVRFAGGHEWTDAFRQAAGAWLERVVGH
jgi:predicted esterase